MVNASLITDTQWKNDCKLLGLRCADWRAYKKKTLAQWASDSKNSARKSDLAAGARAAKGVADEQRRRTLMHSKWLLNPMCAVDGSCSTDAPFLSMGDNGLMEVHKEKDDVDFIRNFYAEEAANVASLNALKTEANNIMYNVRDQIRQQDPGAGAIPGNYLRDAMVRDADKYSREYDHMLFPRGSDMHKIIQKRRSDQTLDVATDVVLGVVFPPYGAMELAAVAGDGICNVAYAKAGDEMDKQGMDCDGFDMGEADLTYTGLMDQVTISEMKNQDHAVSLKQYLKEDAAVNKLGRAAAYESTDQNLIMSVKSRFRTTKDLQYAKVTSLWNAYNPSKWSATNPRKQKLVTSGQGKHESTWQTSRSAQVNDFNSFIADGSMQGCDPLTDPVCGEMLLQWCAKNPEYKWVCDKANIPRKEALGRFTIGDDGHETGGFFPYDLFEEPAPSEYFDLEFNHAAHAELILGL